MEVCPLSREVMLPIMPDATSIRPITERLSLFPILLYPQHHWFTLRLPTFFEEYYGLTVFVLSNMSGLGRSLFAGGFNVHDRRVDSPCASHTPFWFKPVSIFGLSHLTTFIENSHMLAIPLYPSPYPP
jgi:hypothetical protein